MINEEIKRITNTVKHTVLQDNPTANVGKTDRIISVGTGAYIFFKGVLNLFSHPLLALTEVGVGAALLHRGVTGNCAIKKIVDNFDENDEPVSAVTRSYSNSVTQF